MIIELGPKRMSLNRANKENGMRLLLTENNICRYALNYECFCIFRKAVKISVAEKDLVKVCVRVSILIAMHLYPNFTRNISWMPKLMK